MRADIAHHLAGRATPPGVATCGPRWGLFMHAVVHQAYHGGPGSLLNGGPGSLPYGGPGPLDVWCTWSNSERCAGPTLLSQTWPPSVQPAGPTPPVPRRVETDLSSMSCRALHSCVAGRALHSCMSCRDPTPAWRTGPVTLRRIQMSKLTT